MAKLSISYFLKLDLTAPYAARGGLGIALLLAGLIGAASQAVAADPPAVEAVTYDGPMVTPHEFTGDLRHLPLALPAQAPAEMPYRPLLRPPVRPKIPPAAAPTEKAAAVISGPLVPMPSPAQNFAGMSRNDNCPVGSGVTCGAGIPPDTNGDVGLNHYIQAVNSAYAIYNKTGTRLASFTENQLWAGNGTICNGSSRGDPVVLYDWLADRWVLTHLAFASSSGPFFQCIAASKTSDPVSGGWWLYALRMDPGGSGPPVGALNDYPKFGIWHDCLYMSANEFNIATNPEQYLGVAFASISRSDLYSGAASLTWSLGFINADIHSDPFTMVPSNLSGQAAASIPAGTRNYFVSESQTAFAFEVRKFTPGANCGGGGSLSTATNVSQASYPSTFGIDSFGNPISNVVPQPNTANKLDNIDDRIMQKVQYRKIGGAESLWVTHNVGTASGRTAMQWAQIDVTAGTIVTAPVQQQIYAPPDTLWRWMGSLAVDNQGNMALGYSTSNGTSPNFPSIAYSGRLASDPPSTLPQTEVQLVPGAGSQTNNCVTPTTPCHRWGDYTAMSVDPADDCTFWYTNQYYSSQANGASGNWQTRIGSFKFPSCVPRVPPSAPTIGTAIAGNASINVAFTPGAPGSGTLINYTADCGGVTNTGGGSPITVTGLANGTSYTCRVKTTTTVGTSAWSAFSNAVTPVVPDDGFPAGGSLPAGWVQPSGSNAPWVVTNDTSYAGALSLKSGIIGNSQKSELSYAAIFSAGNVSFARRVSSELNGDFLEFYIDGVLQNRWSGEVAWSVVSFPISAGTHTLLWRYVKNGSVSSGSDAAWIDSVQLPGNQPVRFPLEAILMLLLE